MLKGKIFYNLVAVVLFLIISITIEWIVTLFYNVKYIFLLSIMQYIVD